MKRRVLGGACLVALLLLTTPGMAWSCPGSSRGRAAGELLASSRRREAPALGAGRQLSPHLGVNELQYDGHRVDDDSDGSSRGNDDAQVTCGEVIELYASLYNPSGGTAYVANATISSSDPYVLEFGNSESTYPPIAVGAAEENDSAFVFELDVESPVHSMPFELEVVSFDGNTTVEFSVDVYRHCAADITCDTVIDLADISAVAAKWRSQVGPGSIYDLDGDGTVTVVDVMLVAAQWQSSCP